MKTRRDTVITHEPRTAQDIIDAGRAWLNEADAANIGGKGTYLDRYRKAMLDLVRLAERLLEEAPREQ